MEGITPTTSLESIDLCVSCPRKSSVDSPHRGLLVPSMVWVTCLHLRLQVFLSLPCPGVRVSGRSRLGSDPGSRRRGVGESVRDQGSGTEYLRRTFGGFKRLDGMKSASRRGRGAPLEKIYPTKDLSGVPSSLYVGKGRPRTKGTIDTPYPTPVHTHTSPL